MAGSFDPKALVAEYGDEALVRELAQILIDTAEAQIQQIFSAIDAMNASALRAAAHRLRGAVVTFRAAAATDLTQTLENMAADNDIASARSIADRLAVSVRELCAEADAWLALGRRGGGRPA
jgi:HPt (histidine-containing phosphotransfer) domain-containing protein